MSMQLSPYPQYRTSNLQSLVRIPSHWRELRAKYLFREVDRRSPEGNEELLSVSHLTGVTPRSQKNVTMFMAETYVGHKLCRANDLVINTMWAWMGALGVARQVGIVSPSYAVYAALDANALVPDYVDQLLRTPFYVTEYNQRSTGINTSRLRLYPERFLEIPIIVPPSGEQRGILNFIRAKDHQIRRLIAAKRRLIALLNEQKQAIIHRAVTRGLDPDVRLKPSGIDWLGDVPEHWKAVRLKGVASVQTGVTLGKAYNNVPLVRRPYLRVANVQDGYLNLGKITTIDVPESEARAAELRPGDVLMTEGGDIDKLGRGTIWHGEIADCLHQNHVFAVRPSADRILPEFLSLLLTSRHGRIYFQVTAKQTTNLASTNSTTLRAFPLELPDVVEQQQMLEYINKETLGIERNIATANREIGLLREYRTRLIADAVTGKLDVRGVALPALDEDVGEGLELEAEEAEGEGEDGAFGDEDADAGEE